MSRRGGKDLEKELMELSREEWTRSKPNMERRRTRSSMAESGEGSGEVSVHRTPTIDSRSSNFFNEDEAELPIVHEATAGSARGAGNAKSNSSGWAKRAFEKRQGRFVCRRSSGWKRMRPSVDEQLIIQHVLPPVARAQHRNELWSERPTSPKKAVGNAGCAHEPRRVPTTVDAEGSGRAI